MSDVAEATAEWDVRERRAYRILDDRRNIEFVKKWRDSEWIDLTVAASLNEPGCVAIQNNGGDPILLDPEEVDQLCRMLYSVRAGTLHFPAQPEPCGECEQVEHAADDCEAAEWDPTPPTSDHRWAQPERFR